MMSHSISWPTAVSNISLREPGRPRLVAPTALAPAAASFVASCGTASAMFGGRLQHVPANRLTVHGSGASQREVAVHEPVHARPAALEVAAGRSATMRCAHSGESLSNTSS